MKFTKKLQNKEFATALSMVIAWRVFLFLPFFINLSILSVQQSYLGGGLANYLETPYLWGWANFDGEHYLSIARNGYQPLQYFFFPFYPILIRILSLPFSPLISTYLYSGLFISHSSFVVAIIGLWKLLKLDYKTRTISFVLVTLLLFPTSFYFVSLYTESLFLCLIVWSFYAARAGKWWAVAILGALACATRLVGIILIPALFFEWLNQSGHKLNSKSITSLLFLLSSAGGLLIYMQFLQTQTGDPLYFFNNVEIFGDQRSDHFIFLPQVFFRYIFKILPHVPLNYFPVVFTSTLEFFVGSLFLILLIYSIKHLRASYIIFFLGGYVLPTLSGSFSSMPRYVLILFPAFLVLGQIIEKLPKVLQIALFLALASTLTIAQALFIKGYWLS